MDFDDTSIKIAGLCAQIAILKQHEMTAFVHCAKINSLIQAFKTLPNDLFQYARFAPRPSKTSAIQAINDLTGVTEELVQLCIQCVHDSGVQFVLTSSTSEVFNHFFSIRETAIKSLKTLNLDSAVKTFTLSPEKLICQDQVDLKQISTILAQIKNEYKLDARQDIAQAIKDRYISLQRKNIRISEEISDELLTLPSLPSAVNLCLLHEQIQYGKEIGHGYSGRVYEGKIAGRPEKVAIKVLNCVDNNALLLRSTRTEITTLSILSHPSILKLLGYTREPPFCFITELMVNGSLADFLDKRPNELTPTNRTVLAIDIARGMEYIHDKCLIHRDLKSFNILLDENKRARIADFGLVRVKSFEPSTGMIGTPQWMAPEVMMCSPTYDQKVDVYSYGILMWELLTSEKPYAKIPPAKLPTMIVKDNLRPTIPESTPKMLEKLIKNCWDADPIKRPTFTQILEFLEKDEYHFPGTNEEELRKIVCFDSFCSNYSSNSEISIHSDETISDDDGEIVCSKAIELLKDGIASKNFDKIEQAGNEIYSINLAEKFNVIADKILPNLISSIEASSDDMKPPVMLILNELLKNKKLYPKFLELGGEKLIISLMDSNNITVASSALTTFSKNITKENVNIDTIKIILKFANCKNAFIRLSASDVLIEMTKTNPVYAQTIPSFLSHFLTFNTKEFPQKAVERIAKTVLEILKIVTCVGSHVVDKLIFIYDTTHDIETKKILAECLVETTRFEEARHEFTKEFWRKAVDDLDNTTELFTVFLNYPTSLVTKDLLEAVARASAYNEKALDIFIMYAGKKPEIVIPLLPINSENSVKLVTLYSQIPIYARNQFEIYIACRDAVGQEDEELACSLMKTLTNSQFFENSGITQLLLSVLSCETDTKRALNFLNVLLAIAKLDFSESIFYSIQTIEELKNSGDETIHQIAQEITSIASHWKAPDSKKDKSKKKHRNSDSGVIDAFIPVRPEGRRIVSSPTKKMK